MYVIGAAGDDHLGYGASGMRNNRATGWNQRVVDGHLVHRAITESMIDHRVDGITNGGDLFHFNQPLPRDVDVANRVDDLRAAAKIWSIGNSGNHDAGGGNTVSAAGVLHRPRFGRKAVYPDPNRHGGIGPHPGLYEVHDASNNRRIPDGIALHFVSHYGLSATLARHGISIDPTPVPGKANVLFCHGVFASDMRLYHVANAHGEERPIPAEWALRGFDALVLSHFHTQGPVPGFGNDSSSQVWYTGSALRRGFSDAPGERGWLKVTICDAGQVTIEPVAVWQRPQLDLPPIEATGLSVADIDDLITGRLGRLDMHDTLSERFTSDGGSIVRQRIIGATMLQRQRLAGLRGRYAELAADASHWTGLVFSKNAALDSTQRTCADGQAWGMSYRVTDFSGDLAQRWVGIRDRLAVPAPLHHQVLTQATVWTDELSPSAQLADLADLDESSTDSANLEAAA